jgi:hypothetical protein
MFAHSRDIEKVPFQTVEDSLSRWKYTHWVGLPLDSFCYFGRENPPGSHIRIFTKHQLAVRQIDDVRHNNRLPKACRVWQQKNRNVSNFLTSERPTRHALGKQFFSVRWHLSLPYGINLPYGTSKSAVSCKYHFSKILLKLPIKKTKRYFNYITYDPGDKTTNFLF